MSKVAKSTLGLMIATVIAKCLGFIRELVLASSYGASMYSDAYLTSIDIPTAIFSIIGGALGAVLIPVYFEVNNNKGEKASLNFINNVLILVTLICTVLAIGGMFFTEELINIFAIGFEGQTLDIAIKFTRITMISVIFTGVGYILSAFLQIKNNFIIPGMISVPKNIIIIISIILSIKYDPMIMVWGTVLGIAIEPMFQLPFAIKNGYKFKYYLKANDEYIKKMFILICPVLIGVAVGQVNMMVDRTLASTLAEGSISALNYANKLNGFVMALFISSIGTVIYPKLAKLSNDNGKEQFNEIVTKSINSILLLLIPISVGAIVLSTPIVRMLFERGQFDSRATNMTAIALIMFSIGMVAFGLRDILGRVFYALQDTKTPMVNGIIAIVMNIVLNLIFVKYLKLAGLALATSLSAIICIFLFFYQMNKRMGNFGQKSIIITAIKSFISAIVMGITTHLTYVFLSTSLGVSSISSIIALLGAVVAGVMVYGVLIIILRVEEVKNVIEIGKKLIKNRKA